MLGGYLEFFMKPGLAETYLRLRKELEELIQNKVCILFVGLYLPVKLSFNCIKLFFQSSF